jgi:hypothetical protein
VYSIRIKRSYTVSFAIVNKRPLQQTIFLHVSLLQNERERAIGMFQAGMTQTEIANNNNAGIDRLIT